MADIAPELVERMVKHLRYCIADIPDRPRHDARSQALWDELKAITDLLPTPVDPDLIEARKLAANAVFYGQNYSRNVGRRWEEFLEGQCDAGDVVSGILKALKRVRAEASA